CMAVALDIRATGVAPSKSVDLEQRVLPVDLTEAGRGSEQTQPTIDHRGDHCLFVALALQEDLVLCVQHALPVSVLGKFIGQIEEAPQTRTTRKKGERPEQAKASGHETNECFVCATHVHLPRHSWDH